MMKKGLGWVVYTHDEVFLKSIQDEPSPLILAGALSDEDSLASITNM